MNDSIFGIVHCRKPSVVLFCFRIQWLAPVTEHSSAPLRLRPKPRLENACLQPSNPAAHPDAARKF